MSIYRIETYTTTAWTYTDGARRPLPTLYTITADDVPVLGHTYTDLRTAEHARACLDYADYGHTRRADGSYAQASTDLGGYPLIAITGDNSVLCSHCALTDPEAIPLAGQRIVAYANRRRIVAFSAHYEGAPLDCDGCSASIPSAYGDPDEPEDDDDGVQHHHAAAWGCLASDQ